MFALSLTDIDSAYLEKHTENREQALIRAMKLGSTKAFDSIYQMYSKRLYTFSLQFIKSHEEAEEIVQDVFIKLWNNREQIKQDKTLHSLLFIMAKHHLINAYRLKVNSYIYEDYIGYINAFSEENTHYRLEYNEFMAHFEQVMKTLPLTQQKVIRLSRLQQLSNREIAEELSLSEQTIKNQLSLGLKVLKEKLNWALVFTAFILLTQHLVNKCFLPGTNLM